MNNPKLDLHGVKHEDVKIMVQEFVFHNQYHLPALIMCGNSNEMIRIAKESLNKINCEFEDSRFGLIRVYNL